MYGAVLYAGAPYGGFLLDTAVPGASSGYTSAGAASSGRASARGGASRGYTSSTAASTGRARRSK